MTEIPQLGYDWHKSGFEYTTLILSVQHSMTELPQLGYDCHKSGLEYLDIVNPTLN